MFVVTFVLHVRQPQPHPGTHLFNSYWQRNLLHILIILVIVKHLCSNLHCPKLIQLIVCPDETVHVLPLPGEFGLCENKTHEILIPKYARLNYNTNATGSVRPDHTVGFAYQTVYARGNGSDDISTGFSAEISCGAHCVAPSALKLESHTVASRTLGG